MPKTASKAPRKSGSRKRSRSSSSEDEQRVQPQRKARKTSRTQPAQGISIQGSDLDSEDMVDVDNGNDDIDDDDFDSSAADEAENQDGEDEDEDEDDDEDDDDGKAGKGRRNKRILGAKRGSRARRGSGARRGSKAGRRSHGQRNANDPSEDDDSSDSDDSDSDAPSNDSSEDSDIDLIDSGSEIEAKARVNESRKKLDKKTYEQRITEGFNALEDHKELQKIAMDQPAKLKRSFEKTKAWLERAKSEGELMRLIPTVETFKAQCWTDQLEQDFLEAYGHSDEVRHVKKLTLPKSNTSFLAMWRKISRVCKVLPTDIIARVHHLQYGATKQIQRQNKKGKRVGDAFADPIWTGRFCDHLVVLALGGPWMGNMKLLSCMIAYVKACQIDDRRGLSWKHGTTCGFMKMMQTKLAIVNRGRSIPQLHKEVRKEVLAQGDCLPAYSSLLRKIEQHFFVPHGAPNDINHTRVTCYSVETRDLGELIKVIRSVRDAGHPHWPSLNEAAKIASTARGEHDAPKNITELRELYKESRLADIRAVWLRDHPTADSPSDDASETDMEAEDLEAGNPVASPDPFSNDYAGEVHSDTPDEGNCGDESDPRLEPSQYEFIGDDYVIEESRDALAEPGGDNSPGNQQDGGISRDDGNALGLSSQDTQMPDLEDANNRDSAQEAQSEGGESASRAITRPSAADGHGVQECTRIFPPSATQAISGPISTIDEDIPDSYPLEKWDYGPIARDQAVVMDAKSQWIMKNDEERATEGQGKTATSSNLM